MARSLLGQPFDIHTGGMDHIPVHHNNEIAQSESANGRQLARYWLHEAFVNIESEKISKSLGNDVYLSDIEAKGYHPLALRYFFLQAHYRSPMNFTWEALGAADEALHRLWKLAGEAKEASKGRALPSDMSRRVVAHLRDDLGTPQALALVWEALRDEDLDAPQVLGVLVAAEPVLGLRLLDPPRSTPIAIPADILALAKERDIARENKDFARSDELRIHMEDRGYRVEDTTLGTVVVRRPG